MNQQHGTMEEAAAENRANSAQRRGTTSSPVDGPAQQHADDAEVQPPPSRGTEMTEQETYDRITANTSPTHGHHTAGSLSESVRPLQRKAPENRGLSINIEKSKKGGSNVPTPAKSPRSFRSSFLLPKGESASNPSNRSMPGAEKLSSGASTPQLTPTVTTAHTEPAKPVKAKPVNLGRNHEYFEGNTFFCIGGRLQNTRHRPVNIATGSLVVMPAVLFFIFSAPYLWVNASPAVPIVFAYIFYISISSFLHASGSDPGVSDYFSFPD